MAVHFPRASCGRGGGNRVDGRTLLNALDNVSADMEGFDVGKHLHLGFALPLQNPITIAFPSVPARTWPSIFSRVSLSKCHVLRLAADEGFVRLHDAAKLFVR
jgi:hypothetical protein